MEERRKKRRKRDPVKLLYVNSPDKTSTKRPPSATDNTLQDSLIPLSEVQTNHIKSDMAELEDEIQRQLEEKAKKNRLSRTNVKSIIKAVFSDKDIADLLSSDSDVNQFGSFAPKLTRSKVKELLKPLSLNGSPEIKKKSEVANLLIEELPEDSSDTDYSPHGSPVSDLESLNSSHISEFAPESPYTFAPSPFTPACPASPAHSSTNVDTIGQRTRSKLSLSKTPLEAIEQQFVPPDVTTDMYEYDCDNDDWLEFLKGFQEPIEGKQSETVEDENDPEYNIMNDDSFNNVDLEEWRNDRAVKISKQELRNLMNEWFGSEAYSSSDEEVANTGSTINSAQPYEKAESSQLIRRQSSPFEDGRLLPNDECDDKTPDYSTDHNFVVTSHISLLSPVAIPSPARLNIPALKFNLSSSSEILNNSSLKVELPVTSDNCLNKIGLLPSLKSSNDACNISEPTQRVGDKSNVIISPVLKNNELQILLLEQQFQQYIQLLVQTFLWTFRHPYVDEEVSRMTKENLFYLYYHFKNNSKTCLKVLNIEPAIKLCNQWEVVLSKQDNYDSYCSFVKKERDKEEHAKKTKLSYIPTIPLGIMNICAMSTTFLYPQLLPNCGIRYHIVKEFTEHESNLVAMGLEEIFKKIPQLEKQGIPINVYEQISLHYVPKRTTRSIMEFIKYSQRRKKENAVSFYIRHGHTPPIEHFVIKVSDTLRLVDYSLDLVPNAWKKFLKKKKDLFRQKVT